MRVLLRLHSPIPLEMGGAKLKTPLETHLSAGVIWGTPPFPMIDAPAWPTGFGLTLAPAHWIRQLC